MQNFFICQPYRQSQQHSVMKLSSMTSAKGPSGKKQLLKRKRKCPLLLSIALTYSMPAIIILGYCYQQCNAFVFVSQLSLNDV